MENRFIKEVLEDGEYGFLAHYPTIIDIGANIGTFSFYIYDFADRIYALEPVEENIKELQKVVEEKNLNKIVVKQLAISNQSHTRMMHRDGDPKMGGWYISESGDYPVDCRTLKDFMDLSEIPYADLVKIDVEGHELDIFSSPLFPKDRIGTIIGEIHYQLDDPRRKQTKEILEWMGFQYLEMEKNHFLARKK